MRLNNLLLLLLLFLVSANVLALPSAKITVRVIDESGNPVEGAIVGIGFTVPVKTGWGSKMRGKKGQSDSNGLFSAEGETEPYDVGFSAKKEGYYRSGGAYKRFTEVTGFIGMRKWQPWNPTVELVLKKIKNPIPLYAYKLSGIEMPGLDKFYGFDLVARDWVIPYGQGTKSDFLFKMEVHQVKSMFEYDATLTLRFSNPGDGLYSIFDEPNKGSVLRLPHHAPLNGYQPELVIRRKRDTKKIYTPKQRKDQNYFFRVRTEMDEQGNITSALYGKIHGRIGFGGVGNKDTKTAKIGFNYYLNPKPNDTNLEFDPKKNLFEIRNSWKEVTEP